jgi:outer membrane protein assembly factor BamA
VGGSSTVRGYHDNGIDAGPDAGLLMLVTNFELRTPLKGAFGLTWFVDGGNVWRHVSDFKPRQLVKASGVGGTEARYDYHWAYGLGLRYRSPVGPIRVEYGRRLREDEGDELAGRRPDRGQLHFSFGSQF